jgi:Zn-dependent peptidase ImmA (M78 family)
MTTVQLALDLGPCGWAAMPGVASTDDSTGGLFRFHFRGSANVWQNSAVYAAADRAWREAPVGASAVVQITGATALDPVRTAWEVRRHLQLGDCDPVPNLIWALRTLGCVVAEMPEGVDHISAFSCWFDETPLALVRARGATRRRVRFDAAHELGHLMMHKGRRNDQEAEAEANLFASALLIPVAAFDGETLKPFAWQPIRNVAERFNVSTLAALRRAFDMGLISKPVYRAAMKDSSRRGWTRWDPYDVQEPEALRPGA